ncbi:MAG: glutamate-1-semialdehyde 2,1-aminomutase [Gammaproteobacteria bacterium]|jgi:glutamate-1-semialdehyde 2,1-aminomutase|nr:aspartate aminotransferase family protein [Chromatiales bacterium]MDP6674699.1 glutamate-1-semialdehyde 2,1-aminomutase [Gammaproteobacteria bacterium]
MPDRSKSSRLFSRARQVTPGGVHSPVRAFTGVGGTPPFIESGKDACLTDVDGNDYVDFCMSWGPLIFGHQDPDIAAAAQAAISRGTSFGTAESVSLELAELITRQIPWVEKIRFVNSGTEAVMSALRLARAVTGRRKILKFDGCYHGHVDAMLVRAGSGLADMATPDSAGIPDEVAASTLVAPLDDLPAVEQIFAAHGDDIAAVIIEPVPANFGLLIQRDGYLARLAALTRAHGALLIFDEVITGFRLAFGGAAEVFGLEPDLVTYGKIIGGGFPVGAYGGRADLLDRVAPKGDVYQAGTLSANPVAMSAGLAALNKLLRCSPYDELDAGTSMLAGELRAVAGRSTVISVQIQHFGSLFWIVTGSNLASEDPIRTPGRIPSGHKERFGKLFHALLNAGFYLSPSAFEVGFLSIAHTELQRQAFVEAFAAALVELEF